MSCWDRFDMKFVLTVPSAAGRRASFLRDAARVGVSPTVYYNPMVPLENLGLSSISATATFWGRPERVSCNLGHYRIVKSAYESGAGSVLVFEDDMRFLRDAALVSRIVDSLPADYDMATLDTLNALRVPPDAMADEMRRNMAGPHWARMPSNPRSFGAYAMSRRGMEWFIGCNDYVFARLPGAKWRLCDAYLNRRLRDPELNYLSAVPCVAVQVASADAMSQDHRDPSSLASRYALLGMDLGAYSLPQETNDD